jgi:hypothetical protein
MWCGLTHEASVSSDREHNDRKRQAEATSCLDISFYHSERVLGARTLSLAITAIIVRVMRLMHDQPLPISREADAIVTIPDAEQR